MQMLQVVFMMALFGGLELDDESEAVDALMPEQVRCLIDQLGDSSFQKREEAAKELFSWGQTAVYPLAVAADEGSPETSVRAFDILQQLYRSDKQLVFEDIENIFQALKHSENLSVAARAQQTLDNNSETRQERAIAQIEKLGGIVNFRERGLDRQLLPQPTIEYIVLSRDWVGGDAGLQLLGRIEEIRNAQVPLYIIRGVQISEESTQNLRAELPFLQIQYRGPARLGVRSRSSQNDENGCLIDEVDPGSAAEAAGLRPNDVVIEIGGQPIGNFQQLISIIETKEPGDSVQIVFRRGAELHEIVTNLQTWTKQPRIGESLQKRKIEAQTPSPVATPPQPQTADQTKPRPTNVPNKVVVPSGEPLPGDAKPAKK